MIKAHNFLDLEWLDHGFGLRDSVLPDGIRTVKQIHSSIVLDAGEPASAGDALLSDQPGVRVGVKTADCVPILIVDISTPAVAAIHAGWRGSAENIAAAAVRGMAARWKTRPENLRAAIGPAIGVCCYEVGPEVASQFERWFPATADRHLDLPAINEAQLRAEGVTNVWKSGECTFCTAKRFFSFRREREHAGRMLSFIGLQKHFGRTLEGPPGKPSDVGRSI
jgi:YfiH family protein